MDAFENAQDTERSRDLSREPARKIISETNGSFRKEKVRVDDTTRRTQINGTAEALRRSCETLQSREPPTELRRRWNHPRNQKYVRSRKEAAEIISKEIISAPFAEETMRKAEILYAPLSTAMSAIRIPICLYTQSAFYLALSGADRPQRRASRMTRRRPQLSKVRKNQPPTRTPTAVQLW